MSFFQYLPPENDDAITADLDTSKPVMVKKAPLTLEQGFITHAVTLKGEIVAAGILAGDRSGIFLKPKAMDAKEFEKTVLEQLRDQENPRWIVTGEREVILDRLVEQAGKKTVPVQGVPCDKISDYITKYPPGRGMEVEKKLAEPASKGAVRQLIEHVDHVMMCQLALTIAGRMDFSTVNPRKVKKARGLDRYLVIECRLPVRFDGTLVDLETTGLNPEESQLVCAGFYRGNKAKIYYNSPCSDDFIDLVKEHLKELPDPYAAYNKSFEERWLDCEFQYELMQVRRAKYKLFRGLTDGFNRGEGKDISGWWRIYTSTSDSIMREMYKARIAYHNLSCVVLETLLLFIYANEHWQAEHQQLGEYIIREKNASSGATAFSRKKSHDTSSSFVSGSNLARVHQRRKRKIVDVQITPIVPPLPSNNDSGMRLRIKDEF